MSVIQHYGSVPLYITLRAGSLSETLLLIEKHTRAGIPPPPPPPQPGTESSSGETEDHSNATRGNGAVEACAKVVQVQEPNVPLKKWTLLRLKQVTRKGAVPQLSVFSKV